MYPLRDVTYFLKSFIHSFTFILITVPLYRRKFCDGHIILVLCLYLNELSALSIKTREDFKKNNKQKLPSKFKLIKILILLLFNLEIGNITPLRSQITN